MRTDNLWKPEDWEEYYTIVNDKGQFALEKRMWRDGDRDCENDFYAGNVFEDLIEPERLIRSFNNALYDGHSHGETEHGWVIRSSNDDNDTINIKGGTLEDAMYNALTFMGFDVVRQNQLGLHNESEEYNEN